MDMSEQDVFDPRDFEQVMKGASQFDASAFKLPGNRSVVLGGLELQRFALWMARQRVAALPIEATGRRASDQVQRERMQALADENQQLKIQVQIMEACRAGDRRKQILPISHPERRLTSQPS